MQQRIGRVAQRPGQTGRHSPGQLVLTRRQKSHSTHPEVDALSRRDDRPVTSPGEKARPTVPGCVASYGKLEAVVLVLVVALEVVVVLGVAALVVAEPALPLVSGAGTR
jgi:hypothetical protein